MEKNDLENVGDQYGEQLKEFQNLLDEAFQIYYKFFKRIRKQLHNKINKHLHKQQIIYLIL